MAGTNIRRIVAGAFFLLAVVLTASPARANINLEFRPADQTVLVGETVNIALYAVSDDPKSDQLLAAMDVIIGWEPAYLRLLGVDDTGGPPRSFSGFPNDPYGLNEVIPPQDGDGIYTFLAQLGNPVAATPEGTLITTFQFEALDETAGTIVEMLESGGDPVGYTVVYDGEIPGKNVTGTLGNASVTIASAVIPTVSEWGLIAMTLLLLAAATIVLRRRRAITT